MSTPGTPALVSPGTSQDQDSFFLSYGWCLNPILTMRQQIQRLREELNRVTEVDCSWQIRECEANIYLFVCSMACTADDYLAWQLYDVSPLCTRFKSLAWLLRPAGSLVNVVAGLYRRPRTRSVMHWRDAWGGIVDRVCGLLTADSNVQEWAGLRRKIEPLLNARLPRALLARRLRIPEGFRCQDLAHHDVFTLADRFMELPIDRSSPVVVIGPRTAGAYMAPLASAYLARAGWPHTSWFSVRPRSGVSHREIRTMARLLSRPGTHAVLIDDFPNTGATHRKLLGILYRLGVLPQNVTILSPRHPHRPKWTLPDQIQQGIRVITVEPSELYKTKLLQDSAWIESVLSEPFRRQGWERVSVQQNAETRALNARFDAQLAEGFHVRLKRVFDVNLDGRYGSSKVRVVAKSAGWGWFSYHAHIAGTRLAGFVPEIIALREGFFFYRWIDSEQKSPSSARMGAYVARRVNFLPLDEDPVSNSIGYRWVGWNEMLEMVRGVYGPYWNRLKVPAIRRHLAKHLNPVRTMLDGQMKTEDWVGSGDQAWKTDFEQHNFGGPEFDLVDPAYDLAGAVFEFGMSEDDERSMLSTYIEQTGDSDVHNRIALFKAFYASVVLKRTTDALSWGGSDEQMRWRESLNRRAREFLTTHMNRYCASVAGSGAPSWPWSSRILFIDLDGVFYSTQLGFPHPTLRVVAALDLLRSRGVAVVVNTARDVGHVRQFCRMYGVPGGLAEQGSVFVDAAGSRELPLLDAAAADQLARCRESLKRTEGIYIDETYEFSVRASRIREGKRVGLGRDQGERLLRDLGADLLSASEQGTHTDITQRGIDKGTGVRRVLHELGIARERAAAIGDSDQDIPMLSACGIRYGSAKCSRAVREAVHFNMELPAAACHLVQHNGRLRLHETMRGDPFEKLLRVADRSVLVQLACLALFASL